MAIDWSDPCARADALRDAYYALLSGGRTQQISYADGNQSRSISYSNSSVDLNRLKAELIAAEEECAAVRPHAGAMQSLAGRFDVATTTTPKRPCGGCAKRAELLAAARARIASGDLKGAGSRLAAVGVSGARDIQRALAHARLARGLRR